MIIFGTLSYPIDFVTLTRVTNNASCNWVSLVQVRSVQFSSSAVNTAYLFLPPSRSCKLIPHGNQKNGWTENDSQ